MKHNQGLDNIDKIYEALSKFDSKTINQDQINSYFKTLMDHYNDIIKIFIIKIRLKNQVMIYISEKNKQLLR